ncbi:MULTISPECIES: gephyrin-like molybdotransferase Glp [Microbacterium]|uniref:Molybdopterin molybdenumtransferase n=1 Tax=Microbacterium trichothecenolyticum TaxID=69370 RepID=A0A0M2HA35_MICTR|nr:MULTISPECIES: gephyrin-like molybdotransferase Glp [Microbacterium]KJL41514.1 Molybdopterin molybdenumtransferase [Microbacterium trichothecenolyticum]MDR7190589.1 molybdopterin molybdotransferase [Microbacterium sp. BE35]
MSGLRAVEEQLADVLAAAQPLPAERIPLADAHGRTLRAPVRAAVDIPVFDNSAMDGFAVRFADVADAAPGAPVTLRVVADLPAGTAADPKLAPGEAARIMTGSPVPTDADAIVPFEDTAGGLADSLGSISVLRAPRALGAHVRRAGEDARAGDEVLPAGVVLGALQVAAVAACGVAVVAVARRPRVAVISTGSELVEPGAPLRRGQIPESNSVLLAALAADAGAEVVRRASVPDEPGDLDAVLAEVTDPRSPRSAEVVVFSGGVSAGAYEVVKTTLESTMTFSKVAMQPGKPQGFGRLPSGALLFGLPGNPVSAGVSFEVFVRPALLLMQGRRVRDRPVLTLPAAADWRTPPGRRQYLPVTIDRTDPGAWRVIPATSGGSHLAGGLGRAEAYAIVPAEVDAVAAGDLVDVMLIS